MTTYHISYLITLVCFEFSNLIHWGSADYGGLAGLASSGWTDNFVLTAVQANPPHRDIRITNWQTPDIFFTFVRYTEIS